MALESVRALLDAQNAAQAHAAHRQRILLAGLAAALACVGAALVYLGVYYGGRMRELSSRVDDIGANVAGIEGSIDMRIVTHPVQHRREPAPAGQHRGWF